jgi:D-beta-D-heptose 7-phosphate kinase/D-beta-D-heptose 1-phosphate adenosyltransferase
MEKKATKSKGVSVRAPIWVAVSGGFDPIHVGHVRMFEKASKLGDKLVVILNNDNWLRAKKGFVFMPEKERAELIGAFPFVDKVVLTTHAENDTDPSVVRSLRAIKPDIFANGGDRFKDNIPEAVVCKELGIKTIFNIGQGGKVQSSSWMIKDASRPSRETKRDWGSFFNWDRGSNWNLKTVYIKPKGKLSLQYHKGRSEVWLLVEGDATATIGKSEKALKKTSLKNETLYQVRPGELHRLESTKGCVLVEVALGTFTEDDVVRLDSERHS